MIEEHIRQLDEEMASLLGQHQAAVQRLAEVPGLGVDSAQQIIAEVGATAATFASRKRLSSWVGACPGPRRVRERTTVIDRREAIGRCGGWSTRRPTPPSRPNVVFSRWCIDASSHAWATHKPLEPLPILCRLIWKILHEGIRYEKRGPTTNNKWKQARTAKMIRELRSLGYRIELLTSPSNTPA